MHKLAVIVGHTSRQQGAVAVGRLAGMSEYHYNIEVAQIMQSLSPAFNMEVGVFMRDAALGYSGQIEKAYDQADQWGADLAIELHFNASANSSARYTITLSSGSDLSLKFANRVQQAMCACFDRPASQDQGVITRGREDRGGLSLIAGKAPAVLVEPFFGSNAADCAMADRVGKKNYAGALLRAAARMADDLPRRKMRQSRSMQGQMLAAVGTGTTVTGGATGDVANGLSDAGTALQAVSQVSPWLMVVGTLLTIAGIALTVYARWDDHKEGRR